MSRAGQPTMIDPRGHRFGAGVSAALLAVAWWIDSPWLVAVACATLLASAIFGLRFSIYGWAWRRISGMVGWPAVALEPEYGPRFAQTIGGLLLAASVTLFGLHEATLGWAAAIAVGVLQGVLAATGFCLGCRLYFLNWWLPSLLTGLWRRGGGATSAGGSR